MSREEVKRGIFYGRLWGKSRKVKEMLMMEYGKCYWCKIEVKVYNDILRQRRPDDEATLDHLKSKNAGRVKGENTPKVLSCRKCNENRARDEIRRQNSA